ncbi:MAG TPA: 50S ribosomal L9 C-terminal domain-containing protein, partial [Kiloniellaceae bacterium]|nr:50S ribosomal L9 C-terminal domain-containing protein [Kiloniellaceae bacterium]
VSGKLEGFSVVIIRQAGDSGQLYGSVSSRDIVEAMGDEAVSVARDQVKLERPIKTLGIHEVRLQLHPEVVVTIGLNVARSEAEAERQAESGRMVTGEEEAEIEAAAEAELEAAVEEAVEATEEAAVEEAGDAAEATAADEDEVKES